MKSRFLFPVLLLVLFGGVRQAFAPANAGSVKVTIFPAAVVAAGAQWKLDGGAPQSSGATLPNVLAGPHSVSFTSVAGWTTPASNQISVVMNQTTTTNGTYVQIVGSNTITLVNGYNAIANQFNQGSNTLAEVLTNPPYGAFLEKWNAGTASFDPQQIFTNGMWIDTSTMLPSTTTLNPGEGAFLFNPREQTLLTFTGTANIPQLPLDPGCGQFLFLSRQTNGLGIYENITGQSPQDGAEIYVYNAALQGDPSQFFNNYIIYTFCGGGWLPCQPVVSVGQAVFVRLPCYSSVNCLTVQQSNILVTASTRTPVSFTPVYSDMCGAGADYVRVLSRPPSGSIFSPGTTPVHCVVVDAAGTVVGADFTVTVAPAPYAPPTQSYGLNIATNLTLIAYQFVSGGNTLQEIMTNVPDGTVVSKYDNTAGHWLQSTYSASLGAWVPPNITLRPGEGAFLQDPTNAGGPINFTLSFTGQPNLPVLPISITNPIVLVSRQTNGPGNFLNITGFNPSPGTTVYKWNGVSYDTYAFNGTNWSPFPPTTLVGEACWIAPNGSATPPVIPIAPTVTLQAVNTSVAPGSSVQLTANISGTPPFHIQWRLNGNAIPGATNPVYVLNSFQFANGGDYDVLVQNAIGTAQDTVGALTPAGAPVAPFSDTFANAGSLPSIAAGFEVGSNVGASTEVGEPSPGFIPGGASVWVQWMAPANGLATFSTAGSSFDTLLAVYTGSNVDNLVPLTFDDDSAGYLCSSVQFNATAGTAYMIQVDGFYGATGNITLNWSLAQGNGSLPVILTQPVRQTVGIGGTASFNVGLPVGVAYVYQWLKNGAPIPAAVGSALTISNAAVTDVGVYQVRVTNPTSSLSVLSFPTDLQINVPDTGQPVNAGARAETKQAAAIDPTVRPNDPYDPTIVAGYTGVQIASGYGLVSEPAEPVHCGVITVATIWQAYAAPASGLLKVADTGTPFKGVLAVYTAANLSLVPLDCSSGHAAGQEFCTFQATNGTTYQIAMSVTNVADITGPIQLETTLLSPPVFSSLPPAETVASNSPLTLSCTVTGSATIGYQWMLNGARIQGATNASLPIASFQAANSGNYAVLVTNSAGTNFFSFAPVYVNNSLEFVNTTNLGGQFFTQLICNPNSNYVFETSTDTRNWTSNSAVNSASGVITLTDAIDTNHTGYLYRARLQVIK
jgi:hypothetical protein